MASGPSLSRLGVTLMLLSVACLASGVAHAVPAPLAPAELEAKATLVAEIEIVEVSCDGAPQASDGTVITNYRSRARTLKAVKGKPGATITLLGEIRAYEDPSNAPAGYPPHAPLPKGWRGTVYLAGGEPYTLVWYNGAVEDPKSSDPGALPECRRGGCGGCALGSPEGDASGVLALCIAVALRRRRGCVARAFAFRDR